MTSTTAETELIDDASRGVNACGLKVAKVIVSMTDADAAELRSALDDLRAASDALAHLRSWITDLSRYDSF